MALYMGAAMAIIMLAFMRKMYENKRVNAAIFGGSALLFVVAFWLVRAQSTVGDVAWMKAMIPHHSIAILTSERAQISDPRARRLADEIILTQRREIAEMEALIADLEGLGRLNSPAADRAPLDPSVPDVTGGSADIEGAPSLTLASPARRGQTVVAERVRVASDAWIVLHPEAEGGGPDASVVLGKAFVMHGESTRVPIGLEIPWQGETVYAMLHEDTGEIGTFEFDASSYSLDPPLVEGGEPVVQSVPMR
jgi:hypothetical protein